MTCPKCGDNASSKHCKRCKGLGSVEVKGCPPLIIPEDIWQAIEAVDLIDKFGTWPEGRGTNHECESFLQAAKRIKELTKRYENG